MLRLLPLLFFFHHSQGYGVQVQGKVDIGNALATIITDMAGQYFQTNTNGKTDLDIGKLLKYFQNIGVSEPAFKPSSDNDEARDESNGENQKKAARDAEEPYTDTRDTYDQEISEEKSLREKTMLEELVGMQESVHVYGKHKKDHIRNYPMNNIKV